MNSTASQAESKAEAVIIDRCQKFLESLGSDHALKEICQGAITRFDELKFPHAKHEMFTFVSTKELTESPFEIQSDSDVDADFLKRHIYPSCANSVLVICDGIYRADLSNISAIDTSVQIKTISESVEDDSVKQYILQTAKKENDVFACINTAFLREGLALEIPAKTVCDSPVQILYISTGSTKAAVTTHPRLLVKVGKLAEAKIIVKYVGQSGNYFVNSVQDFILDDDAGVTYSQIQADPADAWSFSKTRISLNRNSRFIAANASSGCRLGRNHFDADLNQVGGEFRLNGVSVLKNKEQAHSYINIRHLAPHCTSNQHFKNIVNDESRVSIDGTVTVGVGAQLTQSDQLINNLVLSGEAHADSKPNLMIYADDVKCTHGSTVGQIDEEHMFYLKTRGLSQEIAEALLTTSFAHAIVETIAFPDVIEDLNKTLLRKLEANNA
ncbi:MAG: Fe-S cluster assembly protein SufD [Nitrospinales bacterium]